MADFAFYGSVIDSKEVLETIFADEPGMNAVPSLNYPSRRLPHYHSVAPALLNALKINRQLYLRTSYTTSPLSISKVRGGRHAGTFVVDDFASGAVLSITMPMCKKLQGNRWHLAPGYLSHPRSFWDYAANKTGVLPTEFKAGYGRLKRSVKSVLVRKKIGQHLWIGPDGLTLLRENKALILVCGEWLDWKGTFVRSNIAGRRRRPI